jgi:hypothetical protein
MSLNKQTITWLLLALIAKVLSLHVAALAPYAADLTDLSQLISLGAVANHINPVKPTPGSGSGILTKLKTWLINWLSTTPAPPAPPAAK